MSEKDLVFGNRFDFQFLLLLSGKYLLSTCYLLHAVLFMRIQGSIKNVLSLPFTRLLEIDFNARIIQINVQLEP